MCCVINLTNTNFLNAVWFEAVEGQPSNSVVKKMRRYGSDCSPTSKVGGKSSMYIQETHTTKQDNFQLKEKVDGSGMCAKMSSPTAMSFQKTIGQGNSCWFEDGDTTSNTNLGFGSFFRTSPAKESGSSGCQSLNEDLFDVYPVPELHVDAKPSSERLKSDVPAERSNFSHKLAEHEHSNHIHSTENPFLLEIRSRSRQPKLSLFDIRRNPHDPFEDCWQGDSEFPGMRVKEGGTIHGEKEGRIEDASSNKIELQENVCAGSNCVSAENRPAGDASDAGDSCSHHFMEVEDRTPELVDSLQATFSPEHREEIASLDGLKQSPDKSESGHHGKEYVNRIEPFQLFPFCLILNSCVEYSCKIIKESPIDIYQVG